MQDELVRPILSQAHLCPLPFRERPIFAEFDHALRLFPLPNAVIIGDSVGPFHRSFEGTLFATVGGFEQTNFSFYRFEGNAGGDYQVTVQTDVDLQMIRETLDERFKLKDNLSINGVVVPQWGKLTQPANIKSLEQIMKIELGSTLTFNVLNSDDIQFCQLGNDNIQSAPTPMSIRRDDIMDEQYAAGEIDLGGNETWCGVLEQRDVGEISLFWLIFWFHLLSFIFQIIASLQWPLCRYTYSEYVDMGKSPFRWLEYSVSASLMLLSVAVVLGVYNQSALNGIGFLCASCMLCGWISDELKNLPGGRKYAQGAHLLGWFNLLGAYMSILLEFLADLDTDAEIPGFVYAIIGGIFFLFNSFGIVSCVQMRFCKCGGECCRAADKNPRISKQFNRGSELAYCTLSLVAKTFLGWLLYSNVLAGRDSNRPGTCPPDVGEL